MSEVDVDSFGRRRGREREQHGPRRSPQSIGPLVQRADRLHGCLPFPQRPSEKRTPANTVRPGSG